MKSLKNKNSVHAVLLLALVVYFPGASVANAADSTNLTFVINPYTGGLAISVPITGSFPSIESPETTTVVSLTLETVTVTDTRRIGAVRSWTTNVVSTNLLSGSDTLTANTFGYASGAPLLVSGLGIFTEHTRTAINAAVMVESGASTSGNHIVSWFPTLSVPVDQYKAAGTYVGVITHSVF